jgi:3-oxoacyl-[acyl-carrier protein] reductase
MTDLRDRVAVVTGATAGLGRVCCHHLAREGMRLALVARTTAALDALAAELRETASAVQLCPIPADVTQSERVEAMAQRVQAELGPAYLLVNAMNIGRLPGGPFQSSSLDEFELAMNTKPRGYYLTMRALLPGMLERHEGCVINVASGAGVSGSPGFALFSASEFAIVGLSDSVAREVQDRGVHVSVLCPWGVIDSDRVRRILPERDPAGFMDPNDLAETIVYLAKRSARAWVREVIVRAPSAVD